MIATGPSLIAVTTAPAGRFGARVEEIWAAGDAVMPVASDLPRLEINALLDALRPAMLDTGEEVVALENGRPVPPGTAAVVTTSGASGRPKGVELAHDALGRAAAGVHERLEVQPGDRWLCCLPLAHIAGFAILVRSRSLATPPVVIERFDLKAIAAADATLVSFVPTMLRRALEASLDLTRFRAILVGGAPLDRVLRQRAEDAGANVIETYGMTETGGGVVYDGIPLRGVEASLAPGELVRIRGPMLMSGYRLDPRGSAESIRDSWFQSSDVGRYEHDGRLAIVGRADDAIVTGGRKVFPDEVEAALRDHPGIEDVALFGLADAEWGERVAAAIVPTRGAEPSVDDLRAFLSLRLAAHKHPRALIVMDVIPYLASGKPDRRVLRERIARR